MTDTNSTKVCAKCNEEKDFSLFSKYSKSKDGLQSKCKSCDKVYREKNKEKINAYVRKYHIENRESISQKKKEYREKNLDQIRKRDNEWRRNNLEKVLINQKRQWEKNGEKYRKKNTERSLKRTKTDPIYAMRLRIAHRIRLALRGFGFKKSKKTEAILGCDWETFSMHIERQFTKGMTWENRNLWHIDHIVPLATAKTREDIIRLNHYTNLRPLWAHENLMKSSKVEFLL